MAWSRKEDYFPLPLQTGVRFHFHVKCSECDTSPDSTPVARGGRAVGVVGRRVLIEWSGDVPAKVPLLVASDRF